MADQRFGVVIIGAGIIGTSIAYHLARRGRTDVAVLEKEAASGLGSTAKAAGGIRVQFSSRINVELSRLSIERFENFEKEMGVTALFTQAGYLWMATAPDHLRLLKNAVAWAANEPPPVEVDGPGILDVVPWRQRSSMTVHIVNMTNPMMMKGPLRETIPVGPLTARIRLPEGARPGKVKLLTSGKTVAADVRNGVLRVTVPSVDVHEVIALDL